MTHSSSESVYCYCYLRNVLPAVLYGNAGVSPSTLDVTGLARSCLPVRRFALAMNHPSGTPWQMWCFYSVQSSEHSLENGSGVKGEKQHKTQLSHY